jgi:hypothetical protein
MVLPPPSTPPPSWWAVVAVVVVVAGRVLVEVVIAWATDEGRRGEGAARDETFSMLLCGRLRSALDGWSSRGWLSLRE